VADLLSADALDQVAVGLALRAAEVHRLEQVLHHRAHLTELATQPFLQRVRRSRIRLIRCNFVDQALDMQVHGIASR